MSETRNPDFDADVLLDLWRTGMEADALPRSAVEIYETTVNDSGTLVES